MNQFVIIFASVAGIWLICLTFLFLRFYLYYKKASGKGQNQSLVQLLDTVLKQGEEQQEQIKVLKRHIQFLEQEMTFHIQKIGLLRFNPFNDTGGDQSFILALLDKHNTGVLVSGLHTRSGTRWYAKKIVEGKSTEHELSKDEEKALKNAQPLTKGRNIK